MSVSLKWKLRYGAVFLVMMSNLMFELLLTRIFSATMWYHFAFMAVSIAMFGTAVGAVLVQIWPQRFPEDRTWELASSYSALYAASMVLCVVAQLSLHVTFGSTWAELATLACLYLLAAVPFILSGTFICLVLTRTGSRLGAVYCFDLLGAGVACALFVPFMAHADGPRGVLALAVLAALGGALAALSTMDRPRLIASTAVVTACAAAFALHLDGPALRVHWAKGHADPAHFFERWNAFSRLTVDPWFSSPYGWGLSRYLDSSHLLLDQKVVAIDGGASTVITRFDGDTAKVDYLKWDVTALVHIIRPQGRVLVIGVGGGRDILTALAFGHRDIAGVEVNTDVLNTLRGPFADYSGRLAFRNDVALINDDARSFAAHTPDRFAVIQASLVDTWAAAASGAYVLSENALYTKEAFGIFLDRLSADGVLSVSRWYYQPQPGEALRLVSLAASTLRDRGAARPRDHLYLARNTLASPGEVSVATLLVAANPFTPSDLGALREWSTAKGFEEILAPDRGQTDMFAQLAVPQEPTALLASHPLDLSAPSDDRPFFFNMLRLRDTFRVDQRRADFFAVNVEAVSVLAWLLAIVLALSFAFIVGPLWLRRSAAPVPGTAWRLLYFAGLGLGFILIELSQMQRIMIALGHPVYGLTVVLFSLLIAAGLGSLWTQRMLGRGIEAGSLLRALGGLLLLALATGLATHFVAHPLESTQLPLRIAGFVLLLAPLGYFLGIPMASGLALCATDPAGHRALYWGANGAASVCGSVLAAMVSLSFGITATYSLGVLAYAVATLAVWPAFVRIPKSP